MEWVNHFPFPWSQTKSNSAAVVIIAVSRWVFRATNLELSGYFKGEGSLTDRQIDSQPFHPRGRCKNQDIRLVQAGKPGAAALGGGAGGSEQGMGRRTRGAGPRTALQGWDTRTRLP